MMLFCMKTFSFYLFLFLHLDAETSAMSTVRARSSSQGSLHSLEDLNDKENSLRGKEIRQDNKNRLSFKLVKQMKVPHLYILAINIAICHFIYRHFV